MLQSRSIYICNYVLFIQTILVRFGVLFRVPHSPMPHGPINGDSEGYHASQGEKPPTVTATDISIRDIASPFLALLHGSHALLSPALILAHLRPMMRRGIEVRNLVGVDEARRRRFRRLRPFMLLLSRLLLGVSAVRTATACGSVSAVAVEALRGALEGAAAFLQAAGRAGADVGA